MLEPALRGEGSKDNGESCEPDGEVPSENGRKEECVRPAEKLTFKGLSSFFFMCKFVVATMIQQLES